MLGCRSCHLGSVCSIALGTRQTFSKLEIKFMGGGKCETPAKMNYETKILLTESVCASQLPEHHDALTSVFLSYANILKS